MLTRVRGSEAKPPTSPQGVKALAEKHEAEGLSFSETLSGLPSRPFARDGVDAFIAWVRDDGGQRRRAVLACDNAGADFVLGVLPLVRELIRRNIAVW